MRKKIFTISECIFVGAMLFLLFSQSLQAQQRIPVELYHQGNDSIGQRLAYQIKERIRKSTGLRLTNTKEPRLKFIIVSVDVNIPNFPESLSAVSYVITLSGSQTLDFFRTSGVNVCGAKRIDSTAEELVAGIDNEADLFRKFSGTNP